MVVLLTKTLEKGSGKPDPFSLTVPVMVWEKVNPWAKQQKNNRMRRMNYRDNKLLRIRI
jgi:hypothetical protein